MENSSYISFIVTHDVNGLVQDCNISIAHTLEILQSCTKPHEKEI